MDRKLEYSILDVFAEQPLKGNPLAVFHDGHSLTTEEMQAIARETNLSETTFVIPGERAEDDREQGVRVRIFTTQEELPFAGHPTLGTASWLRLHYGPLRSAEQVTLRLNVGPIRVRFPDNDTGPGVFGTMQQNDPVFGAEFDAAEIAEVIGMSCDDLLPGYVPQGVSTGNPFCIVPLRSVAALEKLAIPQQRATAWLRERELRWFYCIAPVSDAEPLQWRARMQWSAGEDPATGSAAGPCIAWLVKNALVPSAELATLMQGVEMKRPSRISARATLRDGLISGVEVSGRTIPVATGAFFLL